MQTIEICVRYVLDLTVLKVYVYCDICLRVNSIIVSIATYCDAHFYNHFKHVMVETTLLSNSTFCSRHILLGTLK